MVGLEVFGLSEVSDASQVRSTFRSFNQAVEEVLRYIAAAEGVENVEIVVDVRAENSSGFSESVIQTVKEINRVLGFDVSEFQDVQW